MQKNTMEAVVLSRTAFSSHAALWTTRLLLVVAGSAFVALCARVSVPLPYSPVPVSMSNFAVLLVGLLLGSRAGFAALLLYLLEGAAGLPVFSNGSLGVLGPTGGYLMAYPFVAFVAGWVNERGGRSFFRALSGAALAEILLFTVGVSWLVVAFHTPLHTAMQWGLYPFLAAEIAKVCAAAGLSNPLLRRK